MFPEQQLLLACSRTRLSREQSQHIRKLADGQLDWAVVLETAVAHRVLPLLDLNLSRSGAAVPSVIFSSLREQVQANALFSYQSFVEMQRLTALLRSGGILCACLKGPSLAASAYGHFSLRQSADLDILVRRKDLSRAIELLLAQGYSHSVDAPVEELCKDRSRYHLSIAARRHSTPIELHWGFGHDGFVFDAGEEAWNRLRPVTANGSPIFVLPIEEELLFLCLHGGRHFWSRLGMICDIAEHTQAHPTLDWPRLLAQARKLGYQRMLLIGFRLASDLLGCDLPEVVRREMLGRSVDSLAKELASRLFNYSVPLSAVRSAAATRRLDVRFRERLRDRVKSSFSIFKPNEKDLALFPLPTAWRWLYYPIRPVRLVVTYVPRFFSHS